MKLAVSNIAWDNAELGEHLVLLRELGCQGVELAPSCIWPEPVAATAQERAGLKSRIAGAGLEVVGFHALLYTRPELQMFQGRDGRHETVAYLVRLAELCSELGGRILVFGSPRNRARHGHNREECMAWAADAFAGVAAACQPLGVTLCIEPLGTDEADFITSSSEGGELVDRVGHPNFMLHLDAKALLTNHEDLAEVLAQWKDRVRHFHVGDPGLVPPGTTGADHRPFGRALRDANYEHYVSIEMRRGFGPSRDVIRSSVAYAKQVYLDVRA